jgi:hypothetical protein
MWRQEQEHIAHRTFQCSGLAEELTFREHDDVHYTGVKLSTRFITTDSEAKLFWFAR